jgi:hypothetical protein
MLLSEAALLLDRNATNFNFALKVERERLFVFRTQFKGPCGAASHNMGGRM